MNAEIFHTTGYLVNRLSRLSLRWTDRRFQELGLAAAQMPVLYTLRDGATSTQTELARMAHIEQPTMAQLLARMERDGLVRRTANPEDGRSSRVSLTASGQRKLPAARAVLAEGNRRALAGLSERETETLVRLLGRVLETVEAMVAEDEAEV